MFYCLDWLWLRLVLLVGLTLFIVFIYFVVAMFALVGCGLAVKALHCWFALC